MLLDVMSDNGDRCKCIVGTDTSSFEGVITRLLVIGGFLFSFVLRTLVVLDIVVVSTMGLRGRPGFLFIDLLFCDPAISGTFAWFV